MWGSYELIERLGAGPTGETWRARQANGFIFVALRKLGPEQGRKKDVAALFDSLAQAQRSPPHRDLVPVVDAGEAQGQHYFARAWVEGVSLTDLMRAVRRRRIPSLPPPVALHVALKILDVLHALHVNGRLIHGHLTGNNVFVLPFGEVKVTDATLTRVMEATITAQVPGATVWPATESAPEQSRGEIADSTTDLFAVGALLFELLTSTRPTERTASGSIVIPASALKQIPPILSTVLVRALEEKRDARYATAAALIEDLKTITAMGLEMDNSSFAAAVRALSSEESAVLPPPVMELLGRFALTPDPNRPIPRELTPPRPAPPLTTTPPPTPSKPPAAPAGPPTSHKHESVVVVSPLISPPARKEAPRPPPPAEEVSGVETAPGSGEPLYVTDPGVTAIATNAGREPSVITNPSQPVTSTATKDFVRTDPAGTNPAAVPPSAAEPPTGSNPSFANPLPPEGPTQLLPERDFQLTQPAVDLPPSILKPLTATNPAVPSKMPEAKTEAHDAHPPAMPVPDVGTDPLTLAVPMPANIPADDEDEEEPRTMIDDELINSFKAKEAAPSPPSVEVGDLHAKPLSPPSKAPPTKGRPTVVVADDDDEDQDARTNLVTARPHELPKEDDDEVEPSTKLMGPTKVVPPATPSAHVGRATTAGRPSNIKVAPLSDELDEEDDDDDKNPPKTAIYTGMMTAVRAFPLPPLMKKYAPLAGGGAALLLVLILVARVVFSGATGSIEISSEPPGADIIVDGELAGHVTPAKLTLSADEPHVIELHLPGKLPWSNTVTPTVDAPQVIRAELRDFTAKGHGRN